MGFPIHLVINRSKMQIVHGTIMCFISMVLTNSICILLLWHIAPYLELELINNWISKSACMHSKKLIIYTVYLAFLRTLIIFIPERLMVGFEMYDLMTDAKMSHVQEFPK